MFSSLTQIKEAFIQGGGGIHLNAVLMILVNLLLTALVCWIILSSAHYVTNQDNLNLGIDCINSLLLFVVYCFIALIPLKKQIKGWLIAGLFIAQISMIINLLAAHYSFSAFKLIWLGDGAYFFGSVLVGFGATRWVTYTYRISTMDKLTRVHNRRFFETMVIQYLHRLQRIPEQACMLSLDIDNFKQINDKFGHMTGDTVLQSIGKILLECARKSDVICRSGGEEFEILLIGATIEQAQEIAQRILDQLAARTPDSIPTLTASIGLTEVRTSDSIDTLRARADKGMYQAKQSGKAKTILV
ncbi:GGDEF domain-containing protein [Neptunicella sp. SCSIO 80796]|uniref:GGDEF domain-containing protein n=1 Tax=Neptunicella plasticusilytica TaxID=3117012 RepID=UPI003A4E281F